MDTVLAVSAGRLYFFWQYYFPLADKFNVTNTSTQTVLIKVMVSRGLDSVTVTPVFSALEPGEQLQFDVEIGDMAITEGQKYYIKLKYVAVQAPVNKDRESLKQFGASNATPASEEQIDLVFYKGSHSTGQAAKPSAYLELGQPGSGE